MIAKRLSTSLLLVALLSCGLLPRRSDPALERQIEQYRYSPDGYVVEGDVRDFATFALVGDAVIDTSSDVPGYRPKAHVDDRGHFSVAIVVRQKRNDFIEQLAGSLVWDDPQHGEVQVEEVAFRARSGTRCSQVFHSRVKELPLEPIVLWLQECTENDLAWRP